MSTATAPSTLFHEFPAATPEEWRAAAEESLDGAPFEKKLVTRTPEGIDLQPIYTRADWEKLPLRASWPGVAPFVRGATPLGSRASGWSISQELPYGQTDIFNRALRADLLRGQNSVNLLLDLATRLGLDPDEAQPGEVGGCGLSIATLDDLKRALREVDLGAVPVYVAAGASGLTMISMFRALLAERNQKADVLRGAIFADPVADWVRRGEMPWSLDFLGEEMATLCHWASREAPRLRVVGVQASLWGDAGAHAVQELAFGLATGVDYLRQLAARGLSPDLAGPRMMFTWSLGSSFFTEVAKLRAARLLWARAVKAAGGGPEAQRLVCHGRSSLWNKTQLDVHNNLLRATTEAFAGIAGGCESMHIAAYDEALRLPDDFSRRIARNTQIILGEECQLGRVVDPAGGSYYVETLTLQLAEKAWTLFQEVERRGGMLAAIQQGYPQAEVARTATQRTANVEARRDVVVGTNMYPNLKDVPPSVETPDYIALAKYRGSQVARYRIAEDAERATTVLAKLSTLLAAPAPAKVDTIALAFGSGATLGEVSKVLNAGMPAAPAVPRLTFRRRSAPFEKLRQRAEAFRTRTGALPAVFLATMGPRKQHGARADFSSGFFASGGFACTTPAKGFATAGEAAAAAIASAAPVVVLCSSDETYPDLVPAFAAAVKTTPKPPVVVLAGLPADAAVQAQFRTAGIDEFIHIRANCAQLLASLQDKLGL